MTSFSAPWGTAVAVVSVLTTLFCIALAIVFFVLDIGSLRLLPIAFFLALPAGAALFTVRGYAIGDGRLHVRRLLGTDSISLDGLRSAERAPGVMKRGLRICGNGGLFSFTGYYHNQELGAYRAWVMHLDRAVVLRFADRVRVISPGEPEAFLEALARETGIPAGHVDS